MTDLIEPGDLVRVIRSHCPAAWEEEQGTYYVAGSGVYPQSVGWALRCTFCHRFYAFPGTAVVDIPTVPGRDAAHPAAWLKKVPPLGELNEIEETQNADA